VKAGRKAGSVRQAKPAGAIIYLGPLLPRLGGRTCCRDGLSCSQRCPWPLLPSAGYRPSTSRCCWCALRTLAPLPVQRANPEPSEKNWVCFCLALSSRSPALGVTQAGLAIGEPDFPSTGPSPPDPQANVPLRLRPTSPAFKTQDFRPGCQPASTERSERKEQPSVNRAGPAAGSVRRLINDHPGG